MIAKYKPTPWIISAAFALVLIAIAGLTFTRAAEKPPAQEPPAAREQAKPVEVLKQEVAKQLELVRNLQAKVDELRGENSIDPGLSETLRALESRRIETRADLQRLSSLYSVLIKQNRADLKRSISTAAPDQQLNELMSSRHAAEQKLAEMSEYPPEHPDFQRAKRLTETIDKQIDDRISGILHGLGLRIEAEIEQLKVLEESIGEAKADYRTGVHPYQKALQELRTQQAILERLQTRLIQEQVDCAIEAPKKD